MKKINILKDNREFERIIKNNYPYRTDIFNIYCEKGSFETYKFGISVSKKVGNAVTRNKIKRQLKNIIDKNNYQKNFNCIIIVKKEILNKDFQKIADLIYQSFKKINIIKGDNNE